MASQDKIFRKTASITTRLYIVIGTMGCLIILELLVLRFCMDKLSAVRAFVGGESLWSKAQKDAVFSLQHYGTTKDEKDYLSFIHYLEIPEGDHLARLELFKENPDKEVVRKGFIQGHIHPDDIDPMIDLLRRLSWVSQLKTAIQIWGQADEYLAVLQQAGKEFHHAIITNDKQKAATLLAHIKEINEKLTPLEVRFSHALGEGSRYLEHIVLSLLTVAVLMVEAIGLSLAFLTARSISRGLNELNQAAYRIGQGNFDTTIKPHSQDEIGELSLAVNQMGLLLRKSYNELELRVQERTAELAKLAKENEQLYEESNTALKRRDEFLSLASHELKTPITSMLLQAELLVKLEADGRLRQDQTIKFSVFIVRQLNRINSLVEEMLDTSRIDLSKLSLQLSSIDLSALMHEICERLKPQFQLSATELKVEIEDKISGIFDAYRLEQVAINLITNALKYAPGKAITIALTRINATACFTVQDQGMGIEQTDQVRIFNRFERGTGSKHTSGLGIGLYITKAIVNSHGGEITVESAVGCGAKFAVMLPLKTA